MRGRGPSAERPRPRPPAGGQQWRAPGRPEAETADGTGQDGWLRCLPDGVELRVRVSPGASSAGVVGFHGDALRVRVTARPVEGAANRELLQVLAAVLGVRPSALSLESGTHAREKRIRVAGMSADAVRARLRPGSSVDTGGRRH